MRLSIVLPAKNESAAIGSTVAGIRQQYPDTAEVEVLVVNDGSTDDTAAVAATAAARGPGHWFLVYYDYRHRNSTARLLGCLQRP